MFLLTKQMKRFFIKGVAFLFILFLIVGSVNYISDPANLFHEISDKMALELLKGKAVYPTSANFNARLLKKTLIENCSKNLDTISIGPSFANNLSAKYASSTNYYNLSVPGGDFNDALAILAMVKNQNINFNRIIISLDTIYFDRRFLDANKLSAEYIDYTNEMIDYLYNDKNHQITGISKNQKGKIFLTMEELFSPLYFRTSYEYILDKKLEIFTRWQVIDAQTDISKIDNSYYLDIDGSTNYFDSVLKKSLGRVLKNSLTYNFDSYVQRHAHADSFYVETFEKFIDDLHSKGKKIEIFITPLPPALYSRLDLNEFPLFTETEEIMQNLKSKYPDIKIFGNYNPEIGGFTNEDFVDERHLKASSYPKLFQEN